MLAVTNQLLLQTTKPREFIDITPQVIAFRRLFRYTERLCSTVYSKHTTGAIKVTGNEPLDLYRTWRTTGEVCPPGHNEYRHNDFKATHRQYDRKRTPSMVTPIASTSS